MSDVGAATVNPEIANTIPTEECEEDEGGALAKLLTPAAGVLGTFLGIIGSLSQQRFEQPGLASLIFAGAVVLGTLGITASILAVVPKEPRFLRIAGGLVAISVATGGLGVWATEARELKEEREEELEAEEADRRNASRERKESPFLAYTLDARTLQATFDVAGAAPHSAVLTQLVVVNRGRLSVVLRKQASTDGLGSASIDIDVDDISELPKGEVWFIGRWVNPGPIKDLCAQILFVKTAPPQQHVRMLTHDVGSFEHAEPCDVPRPVPAE